MSVTVQLLSGEVHIVPLPEPCKVYHLHQKVNKILQSNRLVFQKKGKKFETCNSFDNVRDGDHFYVIVRDPPVYRLIYNTSSWLIDENDDYLQIVDQDGCNFNIHSLDRDGSLVVELPQEGYDAIHEFLIDQGFENLITNQDIFQTYFDFFLRLRGEVTINRI